MRGLFTKLCDLAVTDKSKPLSSTNSTCSTGALQAFLSEVEPEYAANSGPEKMRISLLESLQYQAEDAIKYLESRYIQYMSVNRNSDMDSTQGNTFDELFLKGNHQFGSSEVSIYDLRTTQTSTDTTLVASQGPKKTHPVKIILKNYPTASGEGFENGDLGPTATGESKLIERIEVWLSATFDEQILQKKRAPVVERSLQGLDTCSPAFDFGNSDSAAWAGFLVHSAGETHLVDKRNPEREAIAEGIPLEIFFESLTKAS